MSAALRLAFMGSPEFAVPSLRALHDAGHHVAAVYCQPPRPAGRGQRLTPCPVHREALALGLPVRTPGRLRRAAEEHAAFAELALDVAVVAAYGLILPTEILHAPRRGCLNVHASLLPRWRGASPIQAAVLTGDPRSGVTIMHMDAGLDTGPMLLREAVPLGPRATAAALHDTLAELGARLLLRTLVEWPAPEPQPDEGVTYAPKLARTDGRLDWTQPAETLDRQVRALNPWPGTFATLEGGILKVLAAEPLAAPDLSAAPGTVLDGRLEGGLAVACGTGILRLLQVQAAGGSAMPAAAFLRGHPVPAGSRLG